MASESLVWSFQKFDFFTIQDNEIQQKRYALEIANNQFTRNQVGQTAITKIFHWGPKEHKLVTLKWKVGENIVDFLMLIHIGQFETLKDFVWNSTCHLQQEHIDDPYKSDNTSASDSEEISGETSNLVRTSGRRELLLSIVKIMPTPQDGLWPCATNYELKKNENNDILMNKKRKGIPRTLY